MLKEYIRKIAKNYPPPVGSVLEELVDRVKIDSKDADLIIEEIIIKHAKGVASKKEGSK